MKIIICILVTCVVFVGSLSAQENDNCAEAIALTVGNSCSFATFTNKGASAEPENVATNPSCGLDKGSDVWFTATMPASGVLRMETDNLEGATPHCITIYSGTCGNFTELFCIRQDKTKTIVNPSLAGKTLYIRMFTLNSQQGTSFKLCIWEPGVPVNDNCASAIDLTAGQSCVARTYSNAYTTSEAENIAPNPTCGQYLGGDVWFKTMMPASGNLRIETNPLAGATSKSVTVYSGNCGSFTEVFCNQLDDAKSLYNPSLVGEMVYIRVFSYASDEGGGFEICVYSPDEPFNDNCENALEIHVDKTCEPMPFTNAHATSELENVTQNPSCGQYRGGDVWFKTLMPETGKLQIKTERLSGATYKSLSVYKGSCGGFTEIACAEQKPSLLLDHPELVGTMIYVRVYSFGNEEGGTFSICTTSNPCPEIESDVVQDGMTLTATNDQAIYQWVDCSNGNAPIAGKTGKVFTAIMEGNYAVIVSENSCSAMSDCFEINITGIENEPSDEVRIFPNPVMRTLQIQINNSAENVHLELLSLNGLILENHNFANSQQIQFPMEKWQSGVYILRVTTKEKSSLFTLIKN